MSPIVEPKSHGPAGHSIGSFEMEVARVCKEHLETGRAKAFAFVFANFTDGVTLDIISDHACNRELHRLSGSDLTIFFLWSPKDRYSADEFNEVMMGKLGLPADQHLPCIVFFRLEGDKAVCIEPVSLVSDWLRGYKVLHEAVERFLAGNQQAAYLDDVEFKDIPVKDLTRMLLATFSTPG
ncbi:hypothetical protein [Variovorax sp. RCC_210]|uniref:hypothetical protein n=1 Tax=Variovorax sp. RCC_210 TaxID=3239217 RepID=UPI003525B7DE